MQGVTQEPLATASSSDGGVFKCQIQPPPPVSRCIVMLNESSFFRTRRQGKLTLIEFSLFDISLAIEVKNLTESPLEEIILKQ
jgi:hypothetical protein